MHDHWLVAIALCTAGIGMTLLLFALIFMEVPLSSIDDAQAAPDGTPLHIRGVVRDVQQRGEIAIISMQQQTSIDVIVFGNISGKQEGGTDSDGSDRDAMLSAGDCIMVRGKRSSYNGKTQIAATRIAPCGAGEGGERNMQKRME